MPRIPSPTLDYTARMTSPPDLSFAASLTGAQRTSFYERHKPLAVAMIVAVFFLPFVGLFAGGLFGVVAGVIISVLAYYLTPYLVFKVCGRNRA